MGEKIMEGFPTREEALADFFAAWEPVGGEELVTLDEAVAVSYTHLDVYKRQGAGRAALLPHPLVEDLPAAMQPAGLALEAFAGKRQHVDAMPLGGLACHLLDVVADEPDGAGGAPGHGLRAIALHRLVERAGQLFLAAEDDVGLAQVRGEHPAGEGGTVLFARAPIAVDARKVSAAHRSVRDEQDLSLIHI